MPEQAYLTSIKEALARLIMAEEEAKVLLPAEVLSIHWQASKFSPSAWRTVEAHFRGHDTLDPHLLDTLADLALIADALACLTTITKQAEASQQPIGSLKLAKVSRQGLEEPRVPKRLPPLPYEEMPE